ncbi:FAD binding domain-containing protein [Halorientalis sp.]|uniref:FAD binding domain-containing protein n=1 Tax=Halorientalis sp. TaxID=1931229 RepID=UPI00261BFC5E|nr:FAD binding domain-containing protein [Halorientalis sp.]
MKPAPFNYHRPSTIEEALTLLSETQGAELMAGNQSLGLDMASRNKRPDHIVDLDAVDELSFLDVTNERVEVGAMVTHRTIERSEELDQALPMLPESAKIAGLSVRNRGTMGGSVAEADPAGNYPAALRALEGSINLRSLQGARSVPAREFFTSYMSTDMRENELVESVTVDRSQFPMDRTGMSFIELKRSALGWADVSAAAAVRVAKPDESEPTIEHARLALANVADVPPAVDAVPRELEGEPLTESAAEAVERAATAAADPSEKVHTDGEFKPDIAGTYGRRAIERAYDRATADST